MSRSFVAPLAGAVLVFVAAATSVAAPEPLEIPSAPTRPADPRVRELLGRFPLSFEVNRGQAPAGFDFLVRCRGYHAFVAADAVVFSFEGAGLRMSLDGASRVAPETRGLALPGLANYFLGNDPEKWITEIPTTRGAVYRDAAPGTTWRFGSHARALDFEFDLVPGADGPRLAFDGAETITLADDGSLRLAMPRGVARISAPVAWQDVPGARIDAAAKWVVGKDGAVRIDVSPRDPNRGVRIDPSVTYETYLGGSDNEGFIHADIDAAGAAYVAGNTYSTDFPTTAGAFSQTKQSGGPTVPRTDAFVTKLNSSGSALVYSTYIGATSDDDVYALRVDASGNAHVTGNTYASNYPTTPGVYRASAGSGGGFLTALASNGSSLAYSTFTSAGFPEDIAFGPSSSLYVIEGNGISRYSSGAATLIFSKTVSSSVMTVRKVAADANGFAYVTGQSSGTTSWPATTGAYQTTVAGNADVIVTKLDSGGTVVFTTYVGGTRDDTGFSISVGLAGQPFVAGRSNSTNFPVTSGAYRTTPSAEADCFVTRINASGSGLRFSSFLGVGGSAAPAIRVHPGSSFVVCGLTDPSSGFTTLNAFQSSPGGSHDGYAMKFHRDNSLEWASWCGGSGVDSIEPFGMSPDGTVLLAGQTQSTDLPTVSPYQATNLSSGGAANDAFLLKVPDTLPANLVPTSVTTAALPTWTVGYAYSAPNLAATGGIGPYTWSLASGSLPTGASLSSAGAITGTLTQVGTYTFKVHVEETCEIAAERELTMRVNAAPSISSPSMPQATIGTPYDRVVPVADGSGTMTFAIVAGTAPPGTELGTDGHLTGTPSQLGDFPFTVEVTDGRGATGSRQISLHVNDTPLVTATVIPAWTETRTMTVQFQAARGSGGFTWSHVGGALPTTTTLDPALGRISGPASPAATYDFTIRATDAAGAIAERTFSSKINALPAITSTVMPTAAIGRPYSAPVGLSGGTPPFEWRIAGGLLPAGLSIDGATGVLHGDLTAAATGPVSFDCSDKTGAFANGQVLIPTAEFADLTKKKWSAKVELVEGSPAPLVRYLELTAGAVLGIDVKGGGQIDLGPAARLVDSSGAELDLAPWSRATVKSLSVKGAVIPSTGRWFLTVVPAPEAAGNMQVKVSISPRASWTSGATLDPSSPTEYVFSAPPGAKLAISVKAEKGVAVLPHIVSVIAPDGTDLVPGGKLTEKGASAVFTTKVPLAGGDHRVTFSTRDAGTGAVTWKVALKLPGSYGFEMGDVPAGE